MQTKPLTHFKIHRVTLSEVFHFRAAKPVFLSSLSLGGTDIVSCFMGQNPTVPVYRGEIQTRNLGMAVEAWSPDGKSVCVFRVAELLWDHIL